MNKFLSTSLLALGLSLASGAALAQQAGKIGLVNGERILTESRSSVAATNRLKNEFASRETALTKEGATLKAAIEKYQKEAPTMSPAQRQTREQQLVKQEETFQNKRAQFQEDLANRRNTELEKIQENAKRVIKQIAEREKYSLILGAEAVVYIVPDADITDQVIRSLDGGK